MTPNEATLNTTAVQGTSRAAVSRTFIRRFIFLASLSAFALACPPPAISQCGPSNCSGCCKADNSCELDSSVNACGALGSTCDVCVDGQRCSLGRCVSATGGEAGGSGGSGGGSGAGGGSGTGGGSGGDCRTGTACQGLSYCDLATGLCKSGCAQDSQCETNGVCDLATHSCRCPAGNHACLGQCVSNDAPATCGSSCSPCPTTANGTATCDGNACGVTCDPGSLACGGACASCAIPNASAFACSGTQCEATVCAIGFHPCSGACVSNTAPDTCGNSCGTPCPRPINATVSCDGTSCSSACDPGFVNCGSGCCLPAAVTVGDSHSCGITSVGGIKCWGSNVTGELGNGTASNSAQATAIGSSLTSGVLAVGAGYGFTCALTSAGGVKCWGRNTDGQLGNGSTAQSLTPVDVTGLTSGAVALSVSFFHVCALTLSGGIKCWGRNADGQLGNGTIASSSTPVTVVGLPACVAVSAGDSHTCAITVSGAIKCWGGNLAGQLGNGTHTTSLSPVDVPGLKAVGVSAGGLTTCVRTTTGAVKCWGANSSGQLGNGFFSDSSTPVSVTGLVSGQASVLTSHGQAGGGVSCALSINGGVQCWGNGGQGNLGDGTTTGSFVPVNVSTLDAGVAEIACGSFHSCAKKANGSIVCWGYNLNGQVGDGTTTDSLVPVGVGSF
jgi:alpha-tubulin suppressor-like RCC1 family protein